MAGTFCVTITHCRTDGDKATVAFVVANAALGSEKNTMVFLSTDGVWCAVKGEAEKINEGAPFAPLKELIDKFVAGGGKILVCTPCMKKRGITVVPDILANAGGVAVSYLEWVQDLQSFFWEESEINRTLNSIMTRSFKEVWDFADVRGVPMRQAAVMLAVNKVADAIRTRGVFP